MLRLLATGVVLLAVGAVLGSPPAPTSAPKPPDVNEFLSAAITNGLTESGVEPALAADLAKRDDFVGKCFLCSPSRHALQQYGKLKTAPAGATEAKRLPEDLTKRLKSDDNGTRRAALRALVKMFVEAEYARRDLTAEQKTALQAKMEEMRKVMAGALPSGQKFCPSCDGACRLGPKL